MEGFFCCMHCDNCNSSETPHELPCEYGCNGEICPFCKRMDDECICEDK